MGLGFLKILLSKEIPHYKVSDFLLIIGNPSQPGVSRLLRGLHHALGTYELFFIYDTLVIHYGFPSLTLVLIPCVLQAIATEMSFLMTCVTLNFV